jgi:hypothetical protein
MPLTIVDAMDNAGVWRAFAPDGVTPSTELSLTVDTSNRRPGVDAGTGRIAGTIHALNHSLRRNFAGLNLTNFDELRLWLYSDRPADGTPERPFFLEMRLASAAVALNDPSNTWQRYLPVSQIKTWEAVRLSIGDLTAAIRSAVTVIQLRCASASVAFNCNIDTISAVRDAMIGDVDAALRAQLDGILTLNETPVPAVLHPANGTLTQKRPYIEITHYDIVYARERTQATRPRGDFTDRGYSIRPVSNAYELYYEITAVADDRQSQSQMLESILRALPPRGEIFVNGDPLPMDMVIVLPLNQLGGSRTDRIPLFYRISRRQQVGLSDLVVAAKTISVDGDVRAPR